MPFFPWMSTGSERSLNSFGRDQDQTIARASRSQLEAKLYLDINQCTNIQIHKKKTVDIDIKQVSKPQRRPKLLADEGQEGVASSGVLCSKVAKSSVKKR